MPFSIDFDGRPYKTLTLPCERVIKSVTPLQMEREMTLIPRGVMDMGDKEHVNSSRRSSSNMAMLLRVFDYHLSVLASTTLILFTS